MASNPRSGRRGARSPARVCLGFIGPALGVGILIAGIATHDLPLIVWPLSLLIPIAVVFEWKVAQRGERDELISPSATTAPQSCATTGPSMISGLEVRSFDRCSRTKSAARRTDSSAPALSRKTPNDALSPFPLSSQ